MRRRGDEPVQRCIDGGLQRVLGGRLLVFGDGNVGGIIIVRYGNVGRRNVLRYRIVGRLLFGRKLGRLLQSGMWDGFHLLRRNMRQRLQRSAQLRGLRRDVLLPHPVLRRHLPGGAV
jgi:hypothetical protein